MIPLPSHTRVFLALGATDMRKAINGLSLLVEGTLALESSRGTCLFFAIGAGRRQGPVLGSEMVLLSTRNGWRSIGSRGRRAGRR